MLKNIGIEKLKGVGDKRKQALAKAGVNTVSDLLSYYPRDYSDRRSITKISELLVGDDAVVIGTLLSADMVRTRGGAALLKVKVSDNSGILEIVFFNQIYLRQKFVVGKKYVFFGRVTGDFVSRRMANPEFDFYDGENFKGEILPIYSLSEGLSQNFIRKLTEEAVSKYSGEIEEILPPEIISEFELYPKDAAVKGIHYPENYNVIAKSRERLAFDELLCLQLGLWRLKQGRKTKTSVIIDGGKYAEEFIKSLPYELTKGQNSAIADGVADMKKNTPMNRLVQGDVGCGKTAVASALMYAAVKNGYQCAFMAPTELLATQHLASLTKMFGGFGVRVEVLSGSVKAKEKTEIKSRLKAGEIDILIGTHALIEEDTVFAKLGLIVTDEQHRFGVAQRAKLSVKGDNPHICVMSATPIPRTLALMLYGDLDLSLIEELPKNRQPISTFIVPPEKRDGMYGFLADRIKEGRQIYVVCPLVSESEMLEGVKSAEQHFEDLKGKLRGAKIGLIHGRLKEKEKTEIMALFAAGEIDILVSTTVIEVGIDVANATVMVIENAERFGLSAMHQLRGRVGRGKEKSYCFLMSESKTEKALIRLGILKNESSGFKVAEEDLKIRGPGDFFGNMQHGLPQFKIADLQTDREIIAKVGRAAAKIIGKDGTLASCPRLLSEIEQLLTFKEGNFLN